MAEEKNKQIWENRWKGSENEPRLTLLGKKMLNSKQEILRKVLGMIDFKNAIDVGCGLGYTLSVLEDFKKDSIGIDVSESAVEVCRKKGLNASQKRLEDVRKKYDLVFSDGMLEHFLNFEPYVYSLAKISRKYILIIQTNHQSFWGKTSIYFAELLRGLKNVYEYNYRMEDFIYVFKKYKFEVETQKSFFGGIFKLILFKKNSGKL